MSPYYNSNESNVSKTDLNIVLDIDATLVNTQGQYSYLTTLGIFENPRLLELRSRTYNLELLDYSGRLIRGSGMRYNFWGTERNHLHDFLKFCNAYFKNVVIWSAGTRMYVEAVIKHIYRKIDKKPVLILAQENCVISSGFYTKPLENVYKIIPDMNEKNTFVLDDTRSTFMYVNPDNAIHCPPYEPPPQIEKLTEEDNTLNELYGWLMKPEVWNSRDVRLLDKTRIFSRPVRPDRKL